jgi:superfamily I DNA/RNA helicase
MQVATKIGAVYDIRAPNDESERKAIEKQVRKLSKEYRGCGSEQRKSHLAREMDLLTEGITQAGAGYGVTIHKAQGSTYEDVLFLTGGMRFFRTDAEKKKMAYTAVTRAAKNLILCEGVL